ncbi:MAG TPA: DUF4956 domain-containing protein [Microlunatus sp.]
MNSMIMIGIDLLAIALLTFGVYFPRHHRRDLVVAFLGVNVGVLAVSMVLGSTTIGAGLGLGLFGVLSIIRLRSSEISQHEVAYYFAALALGLLAGLATSPTGLVLGLMILIVGVLVIADHPRLFHGYRQQTIVIDVAHSDEAVLRSHLEMLLGGAVVNLSVLRLDLVNDTTLVDVRYRMPRRVSRGIATAPTEPAMTGPDRELAR